VLFLAAVFFTAFGLSALGAAFGFLALGAAFGFSALGAAFGFSALGAAAFLAGAAFFGLAPAWNETNQLLRTKTTE
jgi:hypothetical protein